MLNNHINYLQHIQLIILCNVINKYLHIHHLILIHVFIMIEELYDLTINHIFSHYIFKEMNNTHKILMVIH